MNPHRANDGPDRRSGDRTENRPSDRTGDRSDDRPGDRTPLTLPLPQPDPLRPPPRLAELRTEQPVARVRTPDGGSGWLVSSYDAVSEVLSDSERFGVTPPGTPTERNDSLLQDGPGHARLRRLVGKAFSARAIDELRPRIEALATERVRAMAASRPRDLSVASDIHDVENDRQVQAVGAATTDLVSALAAPLSITVIAELLGVEIADRERFRSMADAVTASDPFGHDSDPESGLRAWEALGAYVAELVANKREHLGDDLLSRLIEVRDAEDGRLTDAELVTLAGTIVAAGYLTASNAISIGTLLLFEIDGFRRLHQDPDQLPHVVEEVLRTLSGLNGEAFPRWAQRDLTLAGVRIAAGEQVLVRIGAANRDPARFAEPECLRPDRFAESADRFAGSADPDRKPGGRPKAVVANHLTFGRGPHYCLGASLARIELTAALGALARELPGLRLACAVEDVPWIRTQSDSGPTSLPVRW